MAPRAIWKGDISFGLVSVPVSLSSTSSSSGPHFHRMSSDGSCRLRQKLYCPESEKEYDFSDTALGYEIAPDQYVILEREELDAVKPEGGDTIKILDFVELSEIDPIYFHKTYYLLPDKRGARPYQLLVEAMTRKKTVGIAKFVMRRKEYLAALRVIHSDYLALETMYFEEELKGKDTLPELEQQEVSKNELKLAEQLIENYAGPFSPGKYKNEYREELEDMLEEKAKGKSVAVDRSSKKSGKVIDLMEALKKSVQGEKSSSSRKKKSSTKKKSASKKKSTKLKQKKSA